MKLIPEEWSIGLISQFLSGSLRLSLHKSRTTKMLSSLARGENIKVSDKHSSLGQIPRAFIDPYPIIKDGFKQIEHEFPFGKQDFLFIRSVAPGNHFSMKQAKKSSSISF